MELLLILGAIAVVIILAVGVYLFLQQRRSGTIRAVLPPPRPDVEQGGAGNEPTGRDQ